MVNNLFLLLISWFTIEILSISSNSYYSYEDPSWDCSRKLIVNMSTIQTYSLGDESTTTISLPWIFPYYNQQFDSIVLSSNGVLSFMNSSSAMTGTSTSPLTSQHDSVPLRSSSASDSLNEKKLAEKYIVILHSHLGSTHHHQFLQDLEEYNRMESNKKSQIIVGKSFPHLRMVTLRSPTLHHLTYLKLHSYVSDIQENVQFEISPYQQSTTSSDPAAFSWGIDRINQFFLPLDQNMDIPLWTNLGSNVNVYVLDTGIDTTHAEFINSTQREVRNIYSVDGDISDNNDHYGHGTHVAGTIGGNNIGIARNANIYGVKVLSPGGYGSTEMVLAGMNYVLSIKQDREYLQLLAESPPMVVSMSLGYNCADRCSVDALVIAVKYLTDSGIIVTVAAGNNKFNACYYSPASASSAITAAATLGNDMFATTFSNYGQCVDILAPGASIVSACSSTSSFACDAINPHYLTLSGTSMAAPHVSGIIALWLSMTNVSLEFMSYPGRVQEVKNLIQCSSSMNQVTSLTLTPNYLSRIPYEHNNHFSNLTCPSKSDNSVNSAKCNPFTCIYGVCLSSSSKCSCYHGYSGPHCNISNWQKTDPLCCQGRAMNDAFNYPFNSIALFWTDLDASRATISSGIIDTSTFGIKYENIALYGKPTCVITLELLLFSSGDIEISYSPSLIGSGDCISSTISTGMKGPYINGLSIESEQWYGPEALNLPVCTHRFVKYHETPPPSSSPTMLPSSTPSFTPTNLPLNFPTFKPTPTPKVAPGPHLRPTRKPVMSIPTPLPTMKPKKPKSLSATRRTFSKK